MTIAKSRRNFGVVMNVASLRCMAPDDMNPLYTENWGLDDVDFAIYLGCGKDRRVARSRLPYRAFWSCWK